MDWPNVMVGIPAYNRPDTICMTIGLLINSLKYSGNVHIVVSEDGDFQATVEAVMKERRADSACFPAITITGKHIGTVTIVKGPQKGLGANLNHLLGIAETNGYDFIINMDDDHWLMKPLDLDPHVKHLLEDEQAGWIRFYGIGHHDYVGELRGRYWYVRWNSPSLYITSFRPHLKHIRFHKWFGKYPEGLKLGQTEESFCHQCKDIARKKGGPRVLVPLLGDLDWEHGIGVESWQGKGM